MVGAEQSRGTETIMVLKPGRDRQAICQQFQHDVAMQADPRRLRMLFGNMRDKAN